jgi:hypothetical protein
MRLKIPCWEVSSHRRKEIPTHHPVLQGQEKENQVYRVLQYVQIELGYVNILPVMFSYYAARVTSHLDHQYFLTKPLKKPL